MGQAAEYLLSFCCVVPPKAGYIHITKEHKPPQMIGNM